MNYLSGNEAIAKAAIKAGCNAFFGYPITPSSKIMEKLAEEYPQKLEVFLQAESEISAINMVYGAASLGKRTMTVSSSPGISLMQEGISYIAACELPAVIVNVNRVGPGLGNIWPEQTDYFQSTKCGHGGYKLIVLAPNSVQEMADLTIEAFNLADKYRSPILILTDGYIGQMKEGIIFKNKNYTRYDHSDWSIGGTKDRNPHIITSIFLDIDEMEEHKKNLEKKYENMKHEVRYEEYKTEDSEIIVVSYGITSRVVKESINKAREKGLKVGLIRPITLWPFPSKRISELARSSECIIVCELNSGQMIEDVRLAVNNNIPIYFFGKYAGRVPSSEEILNFFQKPT